MSGQYFDINGTAPYWGRHCLICGKPSERALDAYVAEIVAPSGATARGVKIHMKCLERVSYAQLDAHPAP